MNKLRNALIVVPSVAAASLMTSPAFAAGGITDLQTSVDYADAKTVMVAVAGIALGVIVLWKGIQYVRRAVNGG